MADQDDPQEVARLRYQLYVEALQARMPQAQFALLLQAIWLWAAHGGGTARLSFDSEAEKELFTLEVQQELLNLMGLLGAMQPEHEHRADHVVAQLGDGKYAKDATSLVPPDVSADPDQLRAQRDRIDAEQRQRRLDQKEVEGIARASLIPVNKVGTPDGIQHSVAAPESGTWVRGFEPDAAAASPAAP
ncbi:hypothetical protein [Streptomyces sp. AS58]|uniref:hypothetical protein n=1 Tax=Streptomyces sp. AS58 TaxID=1519489 RepID=UPI0006AFB663|nr:hypothetical protein [Streptomyces sp. AS58]